MYSDQSASFSEHESKEMHSDTDEKKSWCSYSQDTIARFLALPILVRLRAQPAIVLLSGVVVVLGTMCIALFYTVGTTSDKVNDAGDGPSIVNTSFDDSGSETASGESQLNIPGPSYEDLRLVVGLVHTFCIAMFLFVKLSGKDANWTDTGFPSENNAYRMEPLMAEHESDGRSVVLVILFSAIVLIIGTCLSGKRGDSISARFSMFLRVAMYFVFAFFGMFLLVASLKVICAEKRPDFYARCFGMSEVPLNDVVVPGIRFGHKFDEYRRKKTAVVELKKYFDSFFPPPVNDELQEPPIVSTIVDYTKDYPIGLSRVPESDAKIMVKCVWFQDYLFLKIKNLDTLKEDIGNRAGFALSIDAERVLGEKYFTHLDKSKPRRKKIITKGRKSFPSSHSSNAAFMGTMTLFFVIWIFKTKHISKLASIPLLISLAACVGYNIWVTISRSVDHRHFSWDIVTGLLTGVSFACLYFAVWAKYPVQKDAGPQLTDVHMV
eukprot:102127_1